MPWPLPWNSFDIVLLRFCAFVLSRLLTACSGKMGSRCSGLRNVEASKVRASFFRIFSICDVNSNSRDDAEIFFTSLR